jgi:hypothetical protein
MIKLKFPSKGTGIEHLGAACVLALLRMGPSAEPDLIYSNVNQSSWFVVVCFVVGEMMMCLCRSSWRYSEY